MKEMRKEVFSNMNGAWYRNMGYTLKEMRLLGLYAQTKRPGEIIERTFYKQVEAHE